MTLDDFLEQVQYSDGSALRTTALDLIERMTAQEFTALCKEIRHTLNRVRLYDALQEPPTIG